MPLYEYECGACGHRFEIIQKFSDQPITECSKCLGSLRKLQSAPAFQLKGTGWYATDYPKAGQTPGDKDSGGSIDDSSSDKAGAKGDRSEKTEKPDKAEKSDTAQKSGATEKKTERTGKASTSAPAKDPSSSSSTAGSKALKSES